MTEHYIEWQAAYDKRHTNPSKDYGIHGVTCRWFVRGPEGAIQFVIYTNWHLPKVRQETRERLRLGHDPYNYVLYEPMAADLGYHARTPQYKGQEPMRDDCEVIGGPCYYDGSGLYAEEFFDLLVAKGGEAVWDRLDAEYAERFLTVAVPA